MSYPFSGERVEILANGMASGVGANFMTMDDPGRWHLRACANSALYTLGGEASGQAAGVTHLRDALEAMSKAVDAAMNDPAFGRASQEVQDALAVAGAQARSAGAAIFEDFNRRMGELKDAAANGKAFARPPAEIMEEEEEEAI